MTRRFGCGQSDSQMRCRWQADDITHYQRVVVAIKEIIRLMGEIGKASPNGRLSDPRTEIGVHHKGTKTQRGSGKGMSLYAWRSWRLGGSISDSGSEWCLDLRRTMVRIPR